MNFFNGLINLFRFDKTNWRAVALCLIAATVFWFFNALNKEHTATISFPVNFKYNQAAFIPVKKLPEDVRLNITGSGWDLLRKSVGFKVDPLLITLDRPSEIKKLPPSSMLALAVAQLNQLKINHVASDTLMVSIDKRVKKRFKLFVTPDQFQFRKEFGRASSISILPDSVKLEGPSSILAKIPDSIRLEFLEDQIDEDVKMEMDIKLPFSEGVTLNNKAATISFKVSELVEAKKRVKLIVIPAPPFRHQLFTDSTVATLRIPATLRKTIDEESSLYAAIDLTMLEPGTAKTVPLIKGKLPPFAEVITVDSVRVRKY